MKKILIILIAFISKWVNAQTKFQLQLSRNGSKKGAAIV